MANINAFAVGSRFLLSTVAAAAIWVRAWSRRVTDLLSLIDDIAFQRIDLRLATRLLALAEGDTVLTILRLPR